MAWIPNVDTPNSKIVGNGNPISKLESKYYLTEDTVVTNWSPESDTSTWKRIIGVVDFKASAPPAVIKFYDGFDELGSKKGRKESTFTITMEDRGDLQTVKRYEGQQIWYLKAVQDDRDLVGTDGKNKYFMLKAYHAKLDSFDYNENDINEIVGNGSFNTATAKNLYAFVTPTEVIATGASTATTGTPYTLTADLKDFMGNVIDATDLSAETLAGEITGIQVRKTTGTPTISIGEGLTDDEKELTFTGTGEVGIVIDVTTKTAGTFTSSVKTITVS